MKTLQIDMDIWKTELDHNAFTRVYAYGRGPTPPIPEAFSLLEPESLIFLVPVAGAKELHVGARVSVTITVEGL